MTMTAGARSGLAAPAVTMLGTMVGTMVGTTMTGATTTKDAGTTDRQAGVGRLVGVGSEVVRSVRARILAWVIVLTALGMAGAAGTAYLLETQRIDERIDRSLQQEIAEFTEFHRTGIDPGTGQPFASVDRLLQVAMSRNVPDEHQTMIAFLPDRTVTPRDALPLHDDAAFRAEATATGTRSAPNGSSSTTPGTS